MRETTRRRRKKIKRVFDVNFVIVFDHSYDHDLSHMINLINVSEHDSWERSTGRGDQVPGWQGRGLESGPGEDPDPLPFPSQKVPEVQN